MTELKNRFIAVFLLPCLTGMSWQKMGVGMLLIVTSPTVTTFFNNECFSGRIPDRNEYFEYSHILLKVEIAWQVLGTPRKQFIITP